MDSNFYSTEGIALSFSALPVQARGEDSGASSLRGKRAVIVEDEGITQLQLRRILRSQGVEVIGVAANGKEAVDVVLSVNPDIVLMDIRMPIMDGLEAAEKILAKEHICIVMLSAFSEDEYLNRAKMIGTCGYIIKPITAETLMPRLLIAYNHFTQNR